MQATLEHHSHFILSAYRSRTGPDSPSLYSLHVDPRQAQSEPGGTAVAPGVVVPDSALQFTFSRSGGPGGQNVNKTNTHATLSVPLDALAAAMPPAAFGRLKQQAGRYLATDRLVIHCQETRSQHRNRQICLERLRTVLVQALVRPRVRRATRPSRGAVQRRLDAKKRRSKVKQLRSRPRRDG
jgi:ribosome-associated protein